MNEVDALEEIERQKRLAAFLKESGGNWARLENVLEQLDKKDILIGRYMSHCPDCAGSNLELSAAKRLESGRKMARVCYYQENLNLKSMKSLMDLKLKVHGILNHKRFTIKMAGETSARNN